MHKYLSRTIKISALALSVLVCAFLLQFFFLNRSTMHTQRLNGFYLEDENSLDVVFIGSSEVYTSFASDYAYELYGFTSYPFATAGNIITQYKYQLQNVLKQQKPKLVVFEINAVLSGEDVLDDEMAIRNYTDNIPMDEVKLEIISKLPYNEQLEYWFPILKYHSLWTELLKNAQWRFQVLENNARGYSRLKGATTNTAFYSQKDAQMNGRQNDESFKKATVLNDMLINDTSKKPLGKTSNKEFRELLDYCKSENLNVVFLRAPHIIVDHNLKRYQRSKTIADVVSEYGYDYYSFDEMFEELNLLPEKDFYNLEHMNIYGQMKFTKYFGKLLVDRYGITPTILTEEQKEQWDSSARFYDAFVAYCEDLILNHKEKTVGENIVDSSMIEQYLK